LGGTKQGVALQSGEFDEPARRGAAAQERRPLPAMVRAQRFTEGFLLALDLLLEWTKAERCNFQQNVLGAEPVGNARKYSKEAIRHGSWTLDVDLAEGVVEEPMAAGVQTAAGIQMAAGVQTACRRPLMSRRPVTSRQPLASSLGQCHGESMENLESKNGNLVSDKIPMQ
jgi:hypothetical protein